MKVKSRSHLGKMIWPVLLIRSSQKFEFMTIFMFSRARNPFLTLLLSFDPFSGDLENSGQLPVQGVLEGTDDCVIYIFEIS